MAQFITPQMQYTLNINGQYHNTLDIEGFSQMMKDPSYRISFLKVAKKYHGEAFAD